MSVNRWQAFELQYFLCKDRPVIVVRYRQIADFLFWSRLTLGDFN